MQITASVHEVEKVETTLPISVGNGDFIQRVVITTAEGQIIITCFLIQAKP